MTSPAAHRCDTQLGPGGGGPRTMARTLRLLLAALDDHDLAGNSLSVLNEFAGCGVCASAVILNLVGMCVSLMPERGPHVVAEFDRQLIVALDQIAAEEP